jgi:cytochrome c-type biogenesis protein CcmF
VHTTISGDLYAVIGASDGKGGWAVRLYRKPVIIWLWAGAMIMAFGGAVSLSDRRHRVGAPSRQKSTAVSGDGLAKPVKA